MEITKNKSYLCSLIIGIILLLIGIITPVPGGALTTYGSLDGDRTDGYYEFDNKYSAIDEYVGGDAYNYEIGASLVAGKMAGTIAAKAIYIVGGAICIVFGLTLMFYQKNTTTINSIVDDFSKDNNKEISSIDHPEEPANLETALSDSEELPLPENKDSE